MSREVFFNAVVKYPNKKKIYENYKQMFICSKYFKRELLLLDLFEYILQFVCYFFLRTTIYFFNNKSSFKLRRKMHIIIFNSIYQTTKYSNCYYTLTTSKLYISPCISVKLYTKNIKKNFTCCKTTLYYHKPIINPISRSPC